MVARLIHRHAVADRSFPRAAVRQIVDIRSDDVAIFGADAVAALAIRDAAHALGTHTNASPRRVELGDLNETPARLPSVLREIERRGARPFMLGGNPDLGTAFIDTLAGSEDLPARSIILLSPRLDVRLPRAGRHHALAVGTQRLIGKFNYDAWRGAGGTVIPAISYEPDVADVALSALGANAGAALMLVDLSVIDTGYAAGASMRNVGGLSPMTIIELTEKIVARFSVRALAFLNLVPERDPRGHSERIAAMIAERVAAQGEARQTA
jgi:arginase family enzyme